MKQIRSFNDFLSENKSHNPYAKYKSEVEYYHTSPRKNGVEHLLATFPDLVINRHADPSDRMYWWTKLSSDAVDLESKWAQSKIKEFMGFRENMNRPELPPLPNIIIDEVGDSENSTITRRNPNGKRPSHSNGQKTLDSIHELIQSAEEKGYGILEIEEIEPGIIELNLWQSPLIVDQNLPEIIYQGKSLDLPNIKEEAARLYQILKNQI